MSRNTCHIKRPITRLLAASAVVMLGACGSAPRHDSEPSRERPAARKGQPPTHAQRETGRDAPRPAPRGSRGGGYYLDDGPGENPPPDLENVAEPVPQVEPLHRGAMRPYVVLGQSFTPMTELQPYRARGVASWYGRRYHGKQTSNGETYDMYAISAAHPTLPLPSYARVTNVSNGRSLVVRINDRGPFLGDRIIDLSYTAAHRLGILSGGSALVDVETILPDASGGSTAYAAAPAAPRSRVAEARTASVTTSSPTPRPYTGEADPILALASAQNSLTMPPVTSTGTSSAQPLSVTVVKPAVAGSGVYLQLGAFGSRDNAEGYLQRARVQFDWLGDRLQVRARDGLFRVHAGPYPDAHEAREIAERLALALGHKPVFVSQ